MKDLKLPKKRFRPEIEGVRTIATLLIAVYHIWFGKVSGGIDVFFVLSGYLMTLSILSRIEKNGSVNFADYFLHLTRRLFPQAIIIIIFTGVCAVIFLPQFEWGEIIAHMMASTFYYENWRLALDSVDYLARDNSASPFQHFWSLSVQGQFYIIWPILLAAVYGLARKVWKTPVRKTLLGSLIVVFVCSIAYSIYQTNINQPFAYFHSFTRMWEFSVGGIFALLSPYLFFTKRISIALGWLGLLIICFTGIIVPVSTVFPGYLALLPISGVLLILIASESITVIGVNRFLAVKPLLYLGSLTYGIYLWHWPLLIFYRSYMEIETVPVMDGILLLLVTILLSIVTTKLVEKPVLEMDRGQNKGNLVVVLTAMFVLACTSIFTISAYIEKATANSEFISGTDYPGAQSVLYEINTATDVDPIPPPSIIKTDLPAFYEDLECQSVNRTEVRKCSYGVLEDADFTIALVGGSHSGHWFPALEELAEEMNFTIDLYSHDGCRFTDEDPSGSLTEECLPWNENLIEVLTENPPDLVFTTSTVNKHPEVPQGFINQWKKLEGITTVFAIRDNPRMKKVVPVCLEQAEDPLECAVTRDQGVSKEVPWEVTEGIPSNVFFADLTDYFCDDTTCYPVIGNVIVYRDDNHLTAEYSKTLAPALKIPLQQALDSLDKTSAR
ncbi:acyltransferase [Sporosarcina sp. P37]|uniref:acyltransferase family protein n=1 Tax=unclassified Sporosarcina TaxID=2647733 RepID=UPI000A17D773|nr:MULTISPECIES: acyltransferase family protein [unclassified Sporosarcina]ARK23844.1 acyltransferase [Sporosarcina sp. P37]PID17230.1 acyltransferase [Sporosarcina sp. P35]